MRHGHRFIWLDLVRGLCAIAVCAGHLRAVMMVDYAQLGATSALWQTFYASTSFGRQAVMVFFVLSGFLVGGAAWAQRQQFDPLRYAAARLARLWVVLLPALVATALIDFATALVAPDVLSGHYRSLWHSGPELDFPYSASLATFFANVFFLQTITAPVFGTNAPLWSLSNEFWYYVIFPLGLVAWQGRTLKTTLGTGARIGLALAALALLAWLPIDFVEGFAIWCMGLIIHATLGKLSRPAAMGTLIVGTMVFAASLGYSKSSALQHTLGMSADLVVGAAFCLWSIGIVNATVDRPRSKLFCRFAESISNFSYSLYLLHFPLVALIGGFFYKEAKLVPDAQGLMAFMGWLGLLLTCGFLFSLAFERRTQAARSKLETLMHWPRSRETAFGEAGPALGQRPTQHDPKRP